MEHTGTFSLGRTDETVAVRLLRRHILPGGGLLNIGDLATVTPAYATLLFEDRIAEPAATLKTLDAAPADTMQRRPVMKKGMVA